MTRAIIYKPDEVSDSELAEKTGAVHANIHPITVYGVEKDHVTTCGKLFFADITKMGHLSEESEIGEIRLFDTLPEELTYPEIQPHLFRLSERMVKKGMQV